MATIYFFEKPGCINNTKQKKLLSLAGHEVVAKNLLTHPWTKAELLSYLTAIPLKDWFNPTAPAITRGGFTPESQTEDSAVTAMLADPLLIRRPLIEIAGKKMAGFNLESINKLATLDNSKDCELAKLMSENLVDCPQKAQNTQCD
ncbi:MAG: hypothetical protein JXR76_31130 [Deltaproteobacteria bacterium]|nr:hypothetical protein [Deltaproteobacteria bacterium]